MGCGLMADDLIPIIDKRDLLFWDKERAPRRRKAMRKVKKTQEEYLDEAR
jgi:hypothetical protein